MKKKWLMMGTGVGIGAVMLVASGLSAMANTSGYDAFKSAMKQNATAASVSNTGSITITDNGTQVLSAEFLAKMDHERQTMSVAATFSSGAEVHAVNVFKQEDRIIVKSDESDVYKQMEFGGPSKRMHGGGDKSGPPAFVEPIIDALMGNLKEISTVEEATDGSKTASLHLSGSRLPAVVNAVGSLAVSKASDTGHWSEATAEAHPFADFHKKLPRLTDNIKVQHVNLDAEISAGNYLERQKGEILITGTDASGLDHSLLIALDFDLSGFGETVPDTVDLTGKQVEVIQHTERQGPPWHH